MARRTLAAGVTLVELMVTIAILAVLAAIAGPSIDQIARGAKLDADTERFQSVLAFARSEAVKRNTVVSIVPAAGGYAYGWQVITDNAANDPDCVLSTLQGEQLLRVQDALSTTTTFATARTIDDGGPLDCDVLPPNPPSACISFGARGAAVRTDGTSLTQVMCLRDASNPSGKYRAIALNRTGQSYLVKVKN
jgi:prepilin-type N-terminal cleavage/methylation domain-containing protein